MCLNYQGSNELTITAFLISMEVVYFAFISNTA